MISISELQEYRGLTLLDSQPGELRFSVPAPVVIAGLGQTVLLEVTCPLVGQNPLLVRSVITPPDGMACPEAWTSENIEQTLLHTLNMYRKMQVRVDAELAEQLLKIDQQERAGRFRLDLQAAVIEYISSELQNFTLADYLSLCGEAYQSAIQNVRHNRGTGSSTNP